MSTPCTVSCSPLPSVVNADALTTGTASSTPSTAWICRAVSSGRSDRSPALTCSAARPAMVSTISLNALKTVRLTRSIAQTSATPAATAHTVSSNRTVPPRMKRRGIFMLSSVTACDSSPPWSPGSAVVSAPSAAEHEQRITTPRSSGQGKSLCAASLRPHGAGRSGHVALEHAVEVPDATFLGAQQQARERARAHAGLHARQVVQVLVEHDAERRAALDVGAMRRPLPLAQRRGPAQVVLEVEEHPVRVLRMRAVAEQPEAAPMDVQRDVGKDRVVVVVEELVVAQRRQVHA